MSVSITAHFGTLLWHTLPKVKMSVCKNWCITINNTEHFIPYVPSIMGYLVQGKEIAPSTGTKHIQAYVQFNKKMRLTAIKKLYPTAHLEPAKGNPDQNREYCVKDGDYQEDGVISKQGKRNDLERFKCIIDDGVGGGRSTSDIIGELRTVNYGSYIRYERALIRDIQRQIPDRTHQTLGFIHWGETGTGKTTYCKTQFPNAFWLSGTKWFNGYEGQSIVIIDEFYGWLPFSMLQRMLDCTPYQVESKGGCLKFIATEVHFTSNKPLESWYPGVDDRVRQSLFRRFEGRIKEYKKLQ